MAKLFAEVTIAGNYKKLAQATKGANAQMKGMAKSSVSMSKIMKASFAGISLLGLTKQLVDLAKAASEDEQGMRLLAKSIENNVPGGKKYTAQVEEMISKLSIMAAVTDDQIRPAFGYLIRATKSVSKSSKLMTVALDLAAGSGVSVEMAASALGRAYNGNYTALNKLVPGIKKLKNPLAEVEKRFKGMAKIQGDNDPFKQMTIMADEAKEEIGKVLLPEFKKFSQFLQTDQGKKYIQDTVEAIKELVKKAVELGKWAAENKDALIAIGVAIKTWQISNAVINSWKTLSTIWSGMKSPTVPGIPTAGGTGKTPGGVIQYKQPAGPKAPGAGGAAGLASLPAVLAGSAALITGMKAMSYYGDKGRQNVIDDIKRAQTEYGKFYSPTEFLLATGKKQTANIAAGGSNMAPITVPAPIVKVEVNPITGASVTKLLKNEASRRGTTVGRMIQG